MKITTKNAHRMVFDLVASGHKFEFDDMLRLWFHGDQHCLEAFLTWLDERGLEIRGKHDGAKADSLRGVRPD